LLIPGRIHVWRVHLDSLDEAALCPPGPNEQARAARLRSDEARRRYLRSHAALRAILSRVAGASLEFAVTGTGKPFLPAAPEIRFNLSHSGDMALVAAALGVEVGVDVERIRPMSDYAEIAERFFPPAAQADLAAADPGQREREFFRHWTRMEAFGKARGVGLYGAGEEPDGAWTVLEISAGPGFAAAVAAAAPGLEADVRDFPPRSATMC
jgi:4'-phosphopantetheinyl transferase